MGGAITDIGNGPNLRVTSVADSAPAPANMRDGRPEATKTTGSIDLSGESGE
ncbi:hypothetical protein [Brevibacterium picturae]|uniref:Uncharacterized protein n=1 Tax=Brevibacterium picturae TaxID=260553 RepID=A0ABN2BH40_9MICO